MNTSEQDLNFDFTDVIKRKAEQTIRIHLSMPYVVWNYKIKIDGVKQNITEQFIELPKLAHRIIYIEHILLYLSKFKHEYNEECKNHLSPNEAHRIIKLKELDEENDRLDDLQYFLYCLLSKDGFDLDKDAFSYEEVNDLNNKIDLILYKLEELKAGEEIIFDEFEDTKSKIKDEFELLKSAYPLGKKTFFQLSLGKITSFIGEKIAGEIFDRIKPQIIAFIIAQAPHLSENVQIVFQIIKQQLLE